jgi:hypothetical protein
MAPPFVHQRKLPESVHVFTFDHMAPNVGVTGPEPMARSLT